MPRQSNYTQSIDNCMSLDISTFSKSGYLKLSTNIIGGKINWNNGANISFNLINIDDNFKSLILKYNWKDEPIKYSIDVVAIPTNLGNGKRWYFVCPNSYKRCLNLICPNGQKYFLHRSVFNLMYQSQKYSKQERIRSYIYHYGMEHYKEKGNELFGKNGRMFYKGKPTKRYLRYIKIQKKIDAGLRAFDTHTSNLLTKVNTLH